MWKQTVSFKSKLQLYILHKLVALINADVYIQLLYRVCITDIYITVNALYHCIGSQAGGRFCWRQLKNSFFHSSTGAWSMPVWDRKYVTAVCLIWSEIPSGIWASQPCLRMSNPVWGEDFTKSYVQCTVNCLSSATSHIWRIEGQRKGLEDVVDNRHDWRGVLQGGCWLWDFMTQNKNLSVEMERKQRKKREIMGFSKMGWKW